MGRITGRVVGTAAALGAPGLASAHPGHLADLAGHDHWVAGIAVGVAVLVGLWAGLRGRRDAEAKAEPDSPEAASDGEAEAS